MLKGQEIFTTLIKKKKQLVLHLRGLTTLMCKRLKNYPKNDLIILRINPMYHLGIF